MAFVLMFSIFTMIPYEVEATGDFQMTVDAVSKPIISGGSTTYEIRLANSGLSDLQVEMDYSTPPEGWVGLWENSLVTVPASSTIYNNFTITVARSVEGESEWKTTITATPTELKSLYDQTTITTSVTAGNPNPQITWAIDDPGNGQVGIGGYREFKVKCTNLANTGYDYTVGAVTVNNSGSDATWLTYCGLTSGFTTKQNTQTINLGALGYTWLYFQVYAGQGVETGEYARVTPYMASVDDPTTYNDTVSAYRQATATGTLGWQVDITSISDPTGSAYGGETYELEPGQTRWFEMTVKYWQDPGSDSADVSCIMTELSGAGWDFELWWNKTTPEKIIDGFGNYIIDNWPDNQEKDFALKITAPTTISLRSIEVRFGVISDIRNATDSLSFGGEQKEEIEEEEEDQDVLFGMGINGLIFWMVIIVIVVIALYLTLTSQGKKQLKDFGKKL